MAVTGTVHPERVVDERGRRAGDALVLTKPLGVGVIATACKHGLAESQTLSAAVEVMTTLNRSASQAALSAAPTPQPT